MDSDDLSIETTDPSSIVSMDIGTQLDKFTLLSEEDVRKIIKFCNQIDRARSMALEAVRPHGDGVSLHFS